VNRYRFECVATMIVFATLPVIAWVWPPHPVWPLIVWQVVCALYLFALPLMAARLHGIRSLESAKRSETETVESILGHIVSEPFLPKGLRYGCYGIGMNENQRARVH